MRDLGGPDTRVDSGKITQILRKWNDGDREAASELLPLVYAELHRIASGYFRRERFGHTLQATAIVHEAYLSIVERLGLVWKNRAHFMGLMAHVMRRILVDHARERGRAKRGGWHRKVALEEATQLSAERPPDVVALDDALHRLSELDARKARLVELRFFGGLTMEQAATALDISRMTAFREWQRAKAWLYRELCEG